MASVTSQVSAAGLDVTCLFPASCLCDVLFTFSSQKFDHAVPSVVLFVVLTYQYICMWRNNGGEFPKKHSNPQGDGHEENHSWARVGYIRVSPILSPLGLQLYRCWTAWSCPRVTEALIKKKKNPFPHLCPSDWVMYIGPSLISLTLSLPVSNQLFSPSVHFKF